MKYILIGTKIKGYISYKKNWKKGEFVKEIFRWVEYMILYAFKIFYEIIEFLNNVTIDIKKEQLKILVVIIIGYIIMGKNIL